MDAGDLVVIDGRVWEVMDYDPNGYVRVCELGALESTLEKSLESRWVDIYLVEMIDPNESGRATLEALATMGRHEEHEQETRGGAPAEELGEEDTSVPPGSSGLAYLQTERKAG